MLSLGIIGGVSWHSTIEYYRHINSSINALYGNQTNPPLVVYNINQAKIHQLQRAGAWDRIADEFLNAAMRLSSAGCQGLLFACNTAHKVFEDVSRRIQLPLLHIADAISTSARDSNISTVGLLGTRFVMECDFIRKRLLDNSGVQVLTPCLAASRGRLHEIIQQELTMGVFTSEAKNFILAEITELHARGANAVVLGCTELPLIVGQQEVDVPLLDTTTLHARLAVDFILGRHPALRTSIPP